MQLKFDLTKKSFEFISFQEDFKERLCYLISGYSKQPEVGFIHAAKATEVLLQLGFSVFSPILYGHTLVQLFGKPLIEEQVKPYEKINAIMLARADVVAILKDELLPDSEGSKHEVNELWTMKKDGLIIIDWETATIDISNWREFTWQDILNS